MNKQQIKNQVILYKLADNSLELQVQLEYETVWLSQKQMAEVFSVDKRTINEHLQNIFHTKELYKKTTIRNFRIVQVEGIRKVTRNIDHYNLDAIISVGYRVNSTKATQFRIWATTTLKQYILQGYAINQNKLEQSQEKLFQLQKTIQFLTEKSRNTILIGQESTIISLLNEYSRSLTILEQFDTNKLPKVEGKSAVFKLNYDLAINVLLQIKRQLASKQEATSLFALERENQFKSILKNIYQSFDMVDLYRTIEEKAAHLLYFLIKDHPFIDGNKRSASFLFIYFLEKNQYLFDNQGKRKINNAALTALSLLIAESDPKEKETMIQLICVLLN